MVYERRRARPQSPGGFITFHEEATGARLHGFGYGECIRVRDDRGKLWRGSAERGLDDTVYYTFRDEQGRVLAGLADGASIVLRDAKGKTWRGFLD